MRHIQDFMATNELSSMKKDYTKNFDDLSNWIRVSEEKLSTQQSLTGRNIHGNDLFNWHYDKHNDRIFDLQFGKFLILFCSY